MLSGYAQEENDKYKNVPNRLREQKDQYDAGEYMFPPQPRNNWSVGLKGGYAFQSSDVPSQPGYALGFSVRKALGHAFSLRLEGMHGITIGQHYLPSRGYGGKPQNPLSKIYRKDNFPVVFYNYRMKYYDATLQGVLNVNNINFYKEQSRWNLYFAAGAGLMGYQTRINALDENDNPYDYRGVGRLNNDPGSPVIGGKKEVLSELDDLLDDTYETWAEHHSDEEGIRLGKDTLTVNAIIMGAGGFSFRVNRRIELEAEYRIVLPNDDLLDGQRWQEGLGGLTRDFDTYSTITLGVHFRLGPGEESLWWSNPLVDMRSDIREAKQVARQLTDDGDGDGVPDIYDVDPDTPPGVPVDPRGRVLDSDGDMIPDHQDAQPFTPKGCDVDSNGIAIDSDGDGVPDCFDKEPGSAPGALVDAKGITINFPDMSASSTTNVYGSEMCILPIIYFDLDKDNIKPEFYPELYYIAQVMKTNPDLRIRAVGHTDNRASNDYNEALSQRRVNNTVGFLVDTYGIDAARFEVSFEGEIQTQIPGLPDSRNPKLEPLHSANRRVEFECIK